MGTFEHTCACALPIPATHGFMSDGSAGTGRPTISHHVTAPASGKTHNCGLLQAQELTTMTLVIIAKAGIGIHPMSRCSWWCHHGPVVTTEVGQGAAVVPPILSNTKGVPSCKQLLMGMGGVLYVQVSFIVANS
jgi:hypothetical protein